MAGIVALLYFKKEKANFKNGILAGIIFAITGIILDSVITVPLFVKDYGLMFGGLGLWVGVILEILTIGVVGAVKKK